MGTRNIIKINETLCNGCGNCIIACAEGAIRLANGKAIVISDKFCDGAGSEACVARHLLTRNETPLSAPLPVGQSQLNNWPIKMKLIRSNAPYLKGANLLIAGDCTGFAYSDIHRDFIKGKVTIVGCPKLDDQGQFVDELTRILKDDDV